MNQFLKDKKIDELLQNFENQDKNEMEDKDFNAMYKQYY